MYNGAKAHKDGYMQDKREKEGKMLDSSQAH